MFPQSKRGVCRPSEKLKGWNPSGITHPRAKEPRYSPSRGCANYVTRLFIDKTSVSAGEKLRHFPIERWGARNLVRLERASRRTAVVAVKSAAA